MIAKWAFIDENNNVIYVSDGDINTMEFNPSLYNIVYSTMVRVNEERGSAEIGMKWNWEINKFE